MKLLTKYVPMANAGLQYLKARLTGRPVPLYVGLFITERCNLKCIYCFPDSPNRKDVKEFSREELFRIIDELYAMGTRYITILGGEPLLRKDFGQIVEYICRKHMIVETGTNGYFTRSRINDLKKLTLVCHSIDGDEEGHDKNRGKGSFRKIIESIELCVANKIPIQMRAVFTKNNVHSLEFLLKLAKKYNTNLGLAEQAIVKPEDKDYVMTPQELREFWKKVREYKKMGYPVDKSFVLLDKIIEYPVDFPADKVFKKTDTLPAGYQYTPCNLSAGYMFLDCDGMVYPCARLFRKYGKSIYEAGLSGAWEYLQQNDCLFCRQSIQDLKSYFFSHDPEALKVALKNFMRK
ncbi:MAG TPA: radical SAM protein [Patescibacteria group bacterium]|nr:radical SAM protein [Patescibacteria group bacterium]